MSKIQFDVDVADGAPIDVDNDLLPVWWMEVYMYTFSINQSKSLYKPILNGSTKCVTKVLLANLQRDKCIILFDTKYKKT